MSSKLSRTDRKLQRLLGEYVTARVADAWAGVYTPEEVADIRAELEAAEAALIGHLHTTYGVKVRL